MEILRCLRSARTELWKSCASHFTGTIKVLLIEAQLSSAALMWAAGGGGGVCVCVCE